MPYLNCPRCQLWLYTAARHLAADECPRCGEELHARRASGNADEEARAADEEAAPGDG